MRTLLMMLMLALSMSAQALRLPDGQLLSAGDDISRVYEYLGKPLMKYKTTAPCGAGRSCKVTRLVYRFDGRKWYVDTRKGQVVDIHWTYR